MRLKTFAPLPLPGVAERAQRSPGRRARRSRAVPTSGPRRSWPGRLRGSRQAASARRQSCAAIPSRFRVPLLSVLLSHSGNHAKTVVFERFQWIANPPSPVRIREGPLFFDRRIFKFNFSLRLSTLLSAVSPAAWCHVKCHVPASFQGSADPQPCCTLPTSPRPYPWFIGWIDHAHPAAAGFSPADAQTRWAWCHNHCSRLAGLFPGRRSLRGPSERLWEWPG